MKRFLAIMIAAAMILTLFSACAKKPEDGDDESASTAEAGDDLQIGDDNGEGGSSGDASDGGNSSGGKSPSGGKSGGSSGGGSSSDGKTDGSSGDTSSGKPSDGKSDGSSGSQSQSGKSSYPNEGNMQSGVSYGDGGQKISADSQITEDEPESDITPDEVQKFTSDGEVDQKYQIEDGLPYVSSVSTSVDVPTVTASTYAEANLKLPAIRITTSNGKDVTSKETYVTGTLSASGGGAAYNLKNVPVDIRGRGNSTWQCFDKKPYKLKFTVKTDLFGMGAAKKWILLANALDETMMRNYLAFSLAHKLGMEFTNEYMFVNVFINDKYKGMYLLTEQIQDTSTRVNVNASKTGVVDTGYLIEGINSLEKTEYKTFTVPEVNGKKLGSSFRFIIESPDDTRCTDEQAAFIRDYVVKVNEAIFTQDWDKITKLVDIDSFVNMFILDEVLLNQDMGYSFYMYKKANGKLFMGPAWDFDQSAGCSSHGGIGYKGWYAGSEHKWFTSLIEMDQFKQLVSKRYADKKNAIHGLLDETDSVINKNSFDIGMSNYVFNTFGSTTRWRTVYEIAKLKTYKQHVVYFKTWYTNRMIWMENQLGIK